MIWHDSCIYNSMRIAISTWNDRIAPVFDTGTEIRVYEYMKDSGGTSLIHTRSLPADASVRTVLDEKPDLLICGAISRECALPILRSGITVYSFISGNIDEVLAGYRNGTLINGRFSMPGCGCPGRRCRKRGKRRRDDGCSNKKV